ncbi:DEAH-box ATP-dependent RNA helicase prp22 [Clavispora lusitaniae]|nr:DEAH-box ATP-dependent RNA helicase prp22 [Clavispora lusitaniae]
MAMRLNFMSGPLLKKVAAAVEKHLGVADSDETLSRFLLSLYEEPLEAFSRAVEANGGSDFPPAPSPHQQNAVSMDAAGLKQEDVVAAETETVRIMKLASISRRKISPLSMVGRRPNQRRRDRFFSGARRLTSLEIETAAGAARASDYPELYEVEEDPAESEGFEVEINPHEPKFLQGQVRARAEPAHIVKNPEGSLSRAAMDGSRLAQEMREQKKEQRKKEQKQQGTEGQNKDKEQSKGKEQASYSKSRKNVSKSSDLAQSRKRLPVYAMREQLLSAVRDNQFVIVVGETGSGKTTQIVQYLYEENFHRGDKIIACTQPRRVAAESVAKRVAQEVGCPLGQEVGYTIRFDDRTSPATRIKYMTDGMLQREALLDPQMSKYAVVMLDEAHERTVATDVLFALLKKAARANPDLRVLATSATLDADKFSRYFGGCPVLHVPGRTFPVEIMYSREPEPDYVAAALDCVMQIHVAEDSGDILVFLTGQDEIDTCCEALEARIKTLGRAVPELLVLPAYSALPPDQQARIFEPAPPGARKVVLATNIAETSITIDGIRYVVDPGFVKLNAYDPRLGMDSLVVSPISQAQANQRSGRAGRTAPGKCFRLYTEEAFRTEMRPNTVPEIQRQNLEHTILMLKAMGIDDVLRFEFMDPPPAPTTVQALKELYVLDALDENGHLTSMGRRMADFPMEPALAKTVLASVDLSCASDVLSVVAMLSVQNVFYRPKDKQAAADQRKQRFHSVHGDHLTLLNVFRGWEQSGRSRSWCAENFVQERAMWRAFEVRKQLAAIMVRFRLDVHGSDASAVRKAFCAGYFRNSAKRDPHEGIFTTLVDQTPVHLHPSSAVYGKSVDYVIYHTLLLTTKEYMHCVSVVDPKWLVELAPRFFQPSDPNNPSERRKRQKIVPLFNRFAENQDSWRLTAQVEEKKRALGRLNQ